MGFDDSDSIAREWKEVSIGILMTQPVQEYLIQPSRKGDNPLWNRIELERVDGRPSNHNGSPSSGLLRFRPTRLVFWI